MLNESKIEKIAKRYKKNYVTDAQLDRYVELGAINEEKAEEIRASKITNQ